MMKKRVIALLTTFCLAVIPVSVLAEESDYIYSDEREYFEEEMSSEIMGEVTIASGESEETLSDADEEVLVDESLLSLNSDPIIEEELELSQEMEFKETDLELNANVMPEEDAFADDLFSEEATEEQDVLAVSGQWGENAYWENPDGSWSLNIYGTGILPKISNIPYGYGITINDGITGIDDYVFSSAFAGGEPIYNVLLAESVKSIGASAFEDCTGLWSINLNKVQVIKENAFANCSVLQQVDLSSAEEIGENAFANCTKLTKIVYPGRYSEFIAKFGTTTGLSHFQIKKDNPCVHSMDATVVKSASSTEKGELEFTCSECGASYSLYFYADGSAASIVGYNIDYWDDSLIDLVIPEYIDGNKVISIGTSARL